MNLKMKTLAAAMIAAGTMGAAQASSILFPYVVNSATVTTVVSVIDVNFAGSYAVPNNLHWVLWYKDGANAENNAAQCVEVNQWLPSSSNDIQTVDLGGKFGSTSKGVLFNDPSINNNWKITNKRFDMANLGAKPLRGFLLIDDEAPLPVDARPMLEGEAMVFEFATGATWGYTAGRDVTTNFTRDQDILFTTGQYVAIKPWGEFATRFFVTPIDTNMFNGNNRVEGAPSDVQRTTLTMSRTLPVGGSIAMYDRDENPVSGSVSQSVVCVGAVNAENLITSSARTLLPDGGWGQLNATNQGVRPDGSTYSIATNASVIKLDFNTKSTFNGEAVTGTFNNAFQLR